MTLLPVLTPIQDYTSDDWWSGACALCFGAIGDKRQELYEHGFALDVDMTHTPQGVVSGGKDRVWKYSGAANYQLALDTGRLGLWPGGLIKVTARSKFGRGVLAQAGTLSPVNYNWLIPGIKDRTESFLAEYSITQGLTDWMALIAGRVYIQEIGDINRLAGDARTQFVNTSLRNSPLMAVIISSFSLHSLLLPISPSPHFTIAPFALSRNDRDMVYGSPGGLFSEYSVGAQAIANWEVAGLSGQFIPIGGWTNKKTSSLDNPLLILGAILGLGDLPQKNGNWMIGFSANQYLYVPKEPSEKEVKATPFIIQPEGIGVFARFHYAPEDRNLFSYFASVGISGRGVIPTRPLDRYGVGFYGLFASDELKNTLLLKDAIGTEWGMEVFYNLAITPWLQFSPSVQYVDSGIKSVDHSVVVTTRLQMYF